MRIEEFPETLARRLHAELDELPVPERGWLIARPDLHRRLRRRRARRAVAATAGIAVVALAAVLVSAGGQDGAGRAPAPAGSARLSRLAARSFGGDPAPQPAADLAYGDGRLFAVVYGQRRTPVLRLDPVTLQVTGRLQAGWGVPPVFGAGALWVAGGSGHPQLWRVDPVTLRVTRRIPVGGQLTALAFGDGALWLTDCPASSGRLCPHHRQRLERIDPASGQVTGSGRLPIGSNWVDLAAGRVILVSAEHSPVFAIDPRTLAIRAIFHVNCDGCQGATGVAVGPDGLYAVSASRVIRLGLASGRVIAVSPRLPFGYAGALAAAAGSLWLGTEDGTFRLDPVTLAPTARVVAARQSLLGTGDTEQALVAGGSVYVSYSGGLARYREPPAA
jgi:hypothetical protein